MDQILHLLVLAAAVATCSMTVTKSKITQPFRENGPEWMQHLFSCPYCMNHWFALFVVVLDLQAPIRLGTFVIVVLTIIAFATIIAGVMIRLLFIPEGEKEVLKSLLSQANSRANALATEIEALHRQYPIRPKLPQSSESRHA